MSIQATDSKHAYTIREIDTDVVHWKKKIKEANKLKPADCDCNSAYEQEMTDSCGVAEHFYQYF